MNKNLKIHTEPENDSNSVKSIEESKQPSSNQDKLEITIENKVHDPSINEPNHSHLPNVRKTRPSDQNHNHNCDTEMNPKESDIRNKETPVVDDHHNRNQLNSIENSHAKMNQYDSHEQLSEFEKNTNR